MPGEKIPKKTPDPVEGAEELFGEQKGAFMQPNDVEMLDIDKLDKELETEEQDKKIQRAMSGAVADRYEKLRREGFNIQRIKQYGEEFLRRIATLRQKQEQGEISEHEAKELYGTEAELNNAMDAFEDSRKVAEKTIPEMAKNVAAVYARFMIDETGGEVRLKDTQSFARDIEKYVGQIRVSNKAEFQKFVDAFRAHEQIAREVAVKEQRLLEEGRLILGVSATSLAELRKEYVSEMRFEQAVGNRANPAWWERLGQITKAAKALRDPMQAHEKFQALRKTVIEQYIQSNARVQEGISAEIAHYFREYVRKKAGKVRPEKQMENLELLAKKKVLTGVEATKIKNELDEKIAAAGRSWMLNIARAPAPPRNIGNHRVQAHMRELISGVSKKEGVKKIFGNIMQKAWGWLKWGEFR